jgi:hypothetical protein
MLLSLSNLGPLKTGPSFHDWVRGKVQPLLGQRETKEKKNQTMIEKRVGKNFTREVE